MPPAQPNARAALYSVHPSIEMTRKWLEALPEKTGRSLEEWVELARKEGPAETVERRKWLKEKHGLGTNNAAWIADWVAGKGQEDVDPEAYLRQAEAWVEEMFAGKKEALRPIYEALLDIGLKLGPDVKACPCKTMVPLYRHHVFAQIKPATNTRIDLGFALGALAAERRLIDTGGFAKKDRITHRIPISTLDEIDDEVKAWLRRAYEQDA